MIFLLVKVSLVGQSEVDSAWKSTIIPVASCTDGKMLSKPPVNSWISPAFVGLYSMVSIEPNALSVEHVSFMDWGEA